MELVTTYCPVCGKKSIFKKVGVRITCTICHCSGTIAYTDGGQAKPSYLEPRASTLLRPPNS